MKNITSFVQKSLKMHIKLFIYKLERLMKEKYPQKKIDFYCSRRKKNIHIGLDRALFFFFLNIRASSKNLNSPFF